MKVSDVLSCKNIAIVGYGSEGRSALRFLQREGVHMDSITILDANASCDVPDGVSCIVGENYLVDLSAYEILIKTPGISPYDQPLVYYQDKMISTTEIFLQLYTGNIIGITGSKGKSTVATMLTNALLSAGKHAILLGNIGKPLLDALPTLQQENYDYVVCEMSSYMIQSLRYARLFACMIVNIYQAHMTWHHGLENYHRDKLKLVQLCDNVVVYQPTYQDFPGVFSGNIVGQKKQLLYGKVASSKNFSLKGKQCFQGTTLLGSLETMLLLGEHNRMNACGVLAMGIGILGLSFDGLYKGISQTKPLPHRLNDLGTFETIRFFDDAIATTPDSTYQALCTMKDAELSVGALFLGGVNQDFDYTQLIATIMQYSIPVLVFFPDSGLVMQDLLHKVGRKGMSLVTRSMQEAVQFAYDHCPKNSVCLLSCAGESMSVWSSYKEKGALFIQYVKALGKK